MMHDSVETDGLDLDTVRQAKNISTNNTSSERRYEECDAVAFSVESDKTTIENEPSETKKKVEDVLLNYSMSHRPRGKCLIFNHHIFSNYPDRDGTEKDVDALFKCFTRLEFEVEVLEDKEVKKIISRLLNLSNEIPCNHDCLVICVLTHGDDDELEARDQSYPVDELYKNFTGENCPNLAGKPKIFILQACRGDQYDDGVSLASSSSCTDVTDGPRKPRTIPNTADFLKIYATTRGYKSFRHPETGSIFIQTLTDVLNQHSHEKDLLSMLTIVNHKVANEFESSSHKRQQPNFESTLLKKLYFNPTSDSSVDHHQVLKNDHGNWFTRWFSQLLSLDRWM